MVVVRLDKKLSTESREPTGIRRDSAKIIYKS